MSPDLNPELPSQKVDQPATLATTIYARLKADILTTRLEPGRKLQSRFLMEQYNVGPVSYTHLTLPTILRV